MHALRLTGKAERNSGEIMSHFSPGVGKPIIFAEKISSICALISGILLLFAIGLIGVEVVLRKIFSFSVGGADELSGYALALCISWSLGYALLHKAHIRIDILYCKLSDKLKSVLDIFSLFSLVAFMAPLTFFAFHVLNVSIERGATANTPLQTPMWIPQGLWFLGLLAFLVTIAIVLISTIYYLAKGDFKSAQSISGVTSLEEEIEQETGLTLPKSEQS